MECLFRGEAYASTFDASIPQGEEINNLPKIGDLFETKKGEIIKILLATVNEKCEKAIYIGVNKKKMPETFYIELNSKQVQLYKRYPEVFFGERQRVNKKIEDPLDMYEFCFEGFKNLPKSELLKRLKTHPNYNELLDKTENELLRLYCESITNHLYKTDIT